MSVLETNVRVVQPGPDLYLNVRRMRVSGQHLDRDLLERACRQLRRRRGLAATPDPTARDILLVASTRPVSNLLLNDDEWEIQAEDVSDSPSRIYAKDCSDVVATLVERSLLVNVARASGLWSLNSPRIWYEENPFKEMEGISAYRRYELAALPIEDVGIGVTADIGTAFLSQHNLDYFFDLSVGESERKHRLDLFNSLSGRKQGQKGTLRYNNGRSVTTCYFEDAPDGLTCQNTGSLVVRGQTYESLYHYYSDVYPGLRVGKDETAVRVSFRNLSRPQPVAARLLRLRIANSCLPRKLSSVTRISPEERRNLLVGFWDGLGPRPLGRSVPALSKGFWRPSEGKAYQFVPPSLEFGKSATIETPKESTQQNIRANYRQRLRSLENTGCYQFPPAAPRIIHIAFPKHLERAAVQAADDVAGMLSKWTNRPFRSNPVSYEAAAEAYVRLRNAGDGLALFILEDEPTAYYEASFNLPGWRVKRITRSTLNQQFKNLTSGAWDRRLRGLSLEAGERRWNSFIRLNALDVLQLLDAVPFRTKNIGAFESQLVIDVGHDRKFFAVSLLIARDDGKLPAFAFDTNVQHKPDNKTEIVNSVLLKDAIVETFKRAMPKEAHPLESLLVIRDGRIQGNELCGLDEAIDALRRDDLLARESRVDIVGLHKTSLKNIRLWAVDGIRVSNVIEGAGINLNPDTFVLCPTGDATLREGTANPIAIVGNGHHLDLSEAAYSLFASAQLNWSSPDVAQRLPLPLKRTDEELEARMSQEIRRVK